MTSYVNTTKASSVQDFTARNLTFIFSPKVVTSQVNTSKVWTALYCLIYDDLVSTSVLIKPDIVTQF